MCEILILFVRPSMSCELDGLSYVCVRACVPALLRSVPLFASLIIRCIQKQKDRAV